MTARAAIRTWTVGPTVPGAACLTAKQRARLALLTDRRDRARAARGGAKADLRGFVERMRRRRLELIGRAVVRRVERHPRGALAAAVLDVLDRGIVDPDQRAFLADMDHVPAVAGVFDPARAAKRRRPAGRPAKRRGAAPRSKKGGGGD